MNEIIKNDHSIENPFKNIFFLTNTNDEYDIEWLLKNMSVHYGKLMNNIINILEAQEKIKDENTKNLNIFSEFSITTYLEYFYIKKSTIIDLLDILYIKYFSLKDVSKKQVEVLIEADIDKHLSDIKDKYQIFREHFKTNILDTRNRIIHDKGYSTRVFKMSDEILTFEIANSNNETILNNINSLFSYYDRNDLIGYGPLLNEETGQIEEKEYFIHTPVMILTNYVVYNFYALFEYIQIFIELIIKKAEIKLNLDEFESNLYESQSFTYTSCSLLPIKNKLIELEKLLNNESYWALYFE